MVPNDSLSPLTKLFSLLDSGVEYAVTSFLIAVGAIFVSSGWRERKGYFFSACITGTVAGIVANDTPYLTNFDYLVSLAGATIGPTVIMSLQHKTLAELINMWRSIKTGEKVDESDDK